MSRWPPRIAGSGAVGPQGPPGPEGPPGVVVFPILAPDGAVAAPSYSWASNPTTGLYHPATADTMGFSAGGTEVFRISAPGGLTPQILAADGVVGTPSLSFLSDPDSGLYRIAANTIGFAVGGALQWSLAPGVLQTPIAMLINQATANTSLGIYGNVTTGNVSAGVAFRNGTSGTTSFTGNSGTQRGVDIAYTLNQSSTAAFSAVRMNLTQTALGTGAQYFEEFQVAGVTVAGITAGTSPGRILVADGTAALPALSFIGASNIGLYRSSTNLVWSTGGTARLVLGGASTIWGLSTVTANHILALTGTTTTGTSEAVRIDSSTFTAAAGAQIGVALRHTINQTGTAGFSSLYLDQTQTALGSGNQRFVSFAVGGTEVAAITSDTASPGRFLAADGTAAAPSLGFLSSSMGIWKISTAMMGIGLDLGATSFATIQRLSGHVYAFGGSGTASGVGLYMPIAGGQVFAHGRILTNTDRPSFYIGQINAASAFAGTTRQYGTQIDYVLNQTGAGGFSHLLLSQTQTALGTGTHRFVSMTIGGTEVAAITSDTTMPGQVLAAKGTVSRPGLSFLASPNSGIYLDNASDEQLRFAVSGVQAFFADMTTPQVSPATDAAIPLGIAALRWSTVYSVTLNTGDINMRDPYPEGKAVEEIAHWKLVEGLDGIWAYNIRTGKKYQLAMNEADMDPSDHATVAGALREYAQ